MQFSDYVLRSKTQSRPNVDILHTNSIFTANIRITALALGGEDIQYVRPALSQCFTCLSKTQLTVVVGALRNAALLQLQGRFHSSSSKVTAAAKKQSAS